MILHTHTTHTPHTPHTHTHTHTACVYLWHSKDNQRWALHCLCCTSSQSTVCPGNPSGGQHVCLPLCNWLHVHLLWWKVCTLYIHVCVYMCSLGCWVYMWQVIRVVRKTITYMYNASCELEKPFVSKFIIVSFITRCTCVGSALYSAIPRRTWLASNRSHSSITRTLMP